MSAWALMPNETLVLKCSVSLRDAMGDDVVPVGPQIEWQYFLLCQGASWLHLWAEHGSSPLRRRRMLQICP